MEIIKILLFSVMLNWCISLQILNQTLQSGRQKTAAIIFALTSAALAGLILLI
jgi:hypothetical protein